MTNITIVFPRQEISIFRQSPDRDTTNHHTHTDQVQQQQQQQRGNFTTSTWKGRRGSESVQTPDMGCMNLKVGFSQNFQNSGLD